MEQIKRIKKMEELFDRGHQIVDRVNEAIDRFEEYLPDLEKLEEYYSSTLWKEDFEDDEDGKLPADLKRGVISEDGLFDFFQEIYDLKDRMSELTETDPPENHYEVGYVNGVMISAGWNNERLGRSSAIAYGLDREMYLTELQEMFGYEDDILVSSKETLKDKMEDWFASPVVSELLEKELGASSVLDFRSRDVLEEAGGENCGFSELFFIEDGFVALFDETAFLFLMGNNE